MSTRPQTKKEKEKMGEVIVESNGRDGLVCVKCFISLTMVLFCFAFVVLFACFQFAESRLKTVASRRTLQSKHTQKMRKKKEKKRKTRAVFLISRALNK